MQSVKAAVLAAAGLLFSTSCASGSKQPPDWVINPDGAGGVAATECVPELGNFSLEREAAVAKARAAIARQLELRVAAMTKVYERSSRVNDEVEIETAFENVSKQVAEQTMRGLKAERTEYLKIRGKQQFCALVRLPPEGRDDHFNRVIDQSGTPVNDEQRRDMYAEFTS